VSKSIKYNIKEVAQTACHQGDLYLIGHDTNQRQCAMEWPTTVWQHCFTNIQGPSELADQNNTVNSSSSENNRKNVQKNVS
jgi:hypothetical protein